MTKQGRPPLNPNDKTVIMTYRLTQGQRDKLRLLGGAAWLRKQIENANPPIEKID